MLKFDITIPTLADSIRCQLSDAAGFPFSVSNDGDLIEIMFHGNVGQTEGLDSGSIADVLAEADGKDVKFRVNSAGGLAYDGLAMYAAIAAHNGKTTAEIEGLAGSAASILVMACDHVRIHASASVFVHRAQGAMGGNASKMRHIAGVLDNMDDQLRAIYSARTGKDTSITNEWITGQNDEGTIFSATLAFENKLVDEIIPLVQKGETPDEEPATDEKKPGFALRAGLKGKLASMGIGV